MLQRPFLHVIARADDWQPVSLLYLEGVTWGKNESLWLHQDQPTDWIVESTYTQILNNQPQIQTA